MNAQLATELGFLAKLNSRQIFHVFESESPRKFSLTKALLDVLYNLCVVQSIETDDRLKNVFERYVSKIKTLLSKKASLATKKRLLQANAPLVVALAETCLLNV